MSDDLHRSAAQSNQTVYDSGWTEKFLEGAPHLKHASIRDLFDRLLEDAFRCATKHSNFPHFLDVGAGEGSVTRRLLACGARVTAIDVSRSQLTQLEQKCAAFGDRLIVQHGAVEDVLPQLRGPYDAIVASAALHHIVDYLGVIREAIRRLEPHGQFLSFQDPLRYDSIGRLTRAFDELSYLPWRVCQGDLWGGLQRRLRRRRGLDVSSPLDNAEYHVLRNGVDQDAIGNLLEDAGYSVKVVRYFSTQSRLFQPLGEMLGVANTFAVTARRKP